MPTLARLLTQFALIGAAAVSPLAQAQPMLYDADGNIVGAPAGADVNGYLGGYVTINSSLVTLHFYGETTVATELSVVSEGYLYFRSADCSGPALVTRGTAIGTLPFTIFAGSNHAWLHVADDPKGLGTTTVNSIMTRHKDCQVAQQIIAAWKAAPAVDVYSLFRPPYSLH